MATSAISHHQYELTDGLARLCLPQEFKDTCRNLAWANSICALFLMVGLVGLKPPEVFKRKIVEPVDPVVVVLAPPEDTPKPVPEEVKPEEIEQVPENVDVAPAVVVVAAADTPNINFAVPVDTRGLQVVVAASAPQASAPPPPSAYAPPVPKATKFTPTAGGTTGGYYPKPEYPRVALKSRYMGTVRINIEVDPAGAVKEASIDKSSGYAVLDEAALEVVKARWKFPPGEKRLYYWDCIFQM